MSKGIDLELYVPEDTPTTSAAAMACIRVLPSERPGPRPFLLLFRGGGTAEADLTDKWSIELLLPPAATPAPLLYDATDSFCPTENCEKEGPAAWCLASVSHRDSSCSTLPRELSSCSNTGSKAEGCLLSSP